MVDQIPDWRSQRVGDDRRAEIGRNSHGAIAEWDPVRSGRQLIRIAHDQPFDD